MPYYASGSHGRGRSNKKIEHPTKKKKKDDPEKSVEKKVDEIPQTDHS